MDEWRVEGESAAINELPLFENLKPQETYGKYDTDQLPQLASASDTRAALLLVLGG